MKGFLNKSQSPQNRIISTALCSSLTSTTDLTVVASQETTNLPHKPPPLGFTNPESTPLEQQFQDPRSNGADGSGTIEMIPRRKHKFSSPKNIYIQILYDIKLHPETVVQIMRTQININFTKFVAFFRFGSGKNYLARLAMSGISASIDAEGHRRRGYVAVNCGMPKEVSLSSNYLLENWSMSLNSKLYMF